MNTTDQRNSILNRDLKNQNLNSNERNIHTTEELFNLDKIKRADDNNREIANRGYTIRDGHNPNKPNPDEKDFVHEDDLDNLDDDFHKDRDLEDNNDDVYEVELEEGEDEDEELDIDGNLNELNDELDNPSDDDFNETEEDLEDIDQDDEEEEEYIEDDIQEDDEEKHPDNDPRKF